MAIYFMFGKYSANAIKGISASRTREASDIIKRLGGKIISIYALLGEHDLAVILELPGLEEAMKASLALTRLTSIGFSTSPAITIEDFDKMVAEA